MATFRVTVSKTLYGTVLIEAENAYEALNKANELTIDDDDELERVYNALMEQVYEEEDEETE